MLTMQGLAVNWLIRSHSLPCLSPERHVTNWSMTQVKARKGCWVEKRSFVQQLRHLPVNNLVKNQTDPDGKHSRTEVWLYLFFILVLEGERAASTSPSDVTGLTSEEIRKRFVFLQEIRWVNFFNKFQLLHSEKISSVLVTQQQEKKKTAGRTTSSYKHELQNQRAWTWSLAPRPMAVV